MGESAFPLTANITTEFTSKYWYERLWTVHRTTVMLEIFFSSSKNMWSYHTDCEVAFILNMVSCNAHMDFVLGQWEHSLTFHRDFMHHIAFHYLPHPSCVVLISLTVRVTMANDMLLKAFGLAMINAKVRLLCELLQAWTQNRTPHQNTWC